MGDSLSDALPYQHAIHRLSVQIDPVVGMKLHSGFLDRTLDQPRILRAFMTVDERCNVPGLLIAQGLRLPSGMLYLMNEAAVLILWRVPSRQAFNCAIR